jgi:tetratricopeptide (TPR) repeat protein
MVLIIAVLVVAALLPMLGMGYFDIRTGDNAWKAQDYKTAADSYSRAARFLFWRNDLWEKAGISASQVGAHADAVRFLERAPSLSEQGWYSLGFSYFQIGDEASALKTFQQGAAETPSARLYAGEAFIFRLQKNWEAERTALENQLQFDAQDAPTQYRLGLLLTFFSPDQALTPLTAASSLDPKFDPAVQTLRAALTVSSIEADESRKRVILGRALGLVNEWELARKSFEDAIQIDEKNAEAWAWLGEAKQQQGADGSVELDRALSIDHLSVIVRALRGLYWSRQAKYPQMLAEYQLAAEYEPTNPAWQVQIGNAHFKLGDLALALASYQRAIDLAPDDPTYWRLLAVFCAENGVHVEDVALPAAQKAVDLAPKDPAALDALGLAYFSSGRYANAEETLKAALEIDPNYFSAHLHRAMNFLAQGDRTPAFNELILVRDKDTSGVYAETAKQLLAQYFP